MLQHAPKGELAVEKANLARFGVLLGCMVGELMLAPIFSTSEAGLGVMRIEREVISVAALLVVGLRPIAVVLFVPTLIAQLVAHQTGARDAEIVAAALRCAFMAYAMVLLVLHVLRQPGVTMDTIAGAACAYMLIALVWMQLFLLLEYWRPGSFDIPEGFLVGKDPSAALWYFSYATLTSVGYGDIHPANSGAGGICAAEAVVGQLYLATMIARMVGLLVARRTP